MPTLPLPPDFQAVFEAAPTPYLVLDRQLVIVAVNDAYLAATRRGRDDLVGRHVFDAFPDNPGEPQADGVSNLRASLERVLRDAVVDHMPIQRYDIPVVDPAGPRFEERHWSPVNQPVLGPAGDVRHIVHLVEDVTALVQTRARQARDATDLARQALALQVANRRVHASQVEAVALARAVAAERERLDAVLHAVPASVIVVDTAGTVLRVSAASMALWGGAPATPGQLLSTSAWRGWRAGGFGADGRPLAPAEWPLVRALGGEAVPGDLIEIETFDPPRRRRVVLASAAPVQADDGTVVGAVMVAVDLSARVRAEQALRDADRQKDQFVTMLAHELRNPLAPIRAAADLLAMERAPPERLRQTSAIILRQVRHMTGMIDDLLDVSRIARGLVRLEPTRVDVAAVLADAVEQVRPLVDARRHRLTIHADPASAPVDADRKRLVQVMTNLLVNAAKYTPEGGRIDAAVARQGDHVVVRVQDNGIGLAPELRERAFELFAQGHRTADRATGGLGIGLALVRRLVVLHGGTVTAQSEGPGTGSTFVVVLPVADAERAPVVAA